MKTGLIIALAVFTLSCSRESKEGLNFSADQSNAVPDTNTSPDIDPREKAEGFYGYSGTFSDGSGYIYLSVVINDKNEFIFEDYFKSSETSKVFYSKGRGTIAGSGDETKLELADISCVSRYENNNLKIMYLRSGRVGVQRGAEYLQLYKDALPNFDVSRATEDLSCNNLAKAKIKLKDRSDRIPASIKFR